MDPEEEGEGEGVEPLVCLVSPLSSVVEPAEGLMEAGPLKVNPDGGETARVSRCSTQPTGQSEVWTRGHWNNPMF